MSLVDATNLSVLAQELIRDEGVRKVAYLDSLGFWTIGVGHLLSHPSDQIWTDEKVQSTLLEDIHLCVNDIQGEAWYRACDTPERQRSILNMRFQLGARGIRTFKNSLRLIQDKEWLRAGQELRKSKWYTQTPVRAERVIRQLETGV